MKPLRVTVAEMPITILIMQVSYRYIFLRFCKEKSTRFCDSFILQRAMGEWNLAVEILIGE